MKKIGILLFAIFYCILIFAQAPKWTDKVPKSGNNTYRYVKDNDIGGTERLARNRAYLRILQTAANSLGVPFDSKVVNDAILNGDKFETISMHFNIPINKVCEYVERFDYQYRAYILCQVANNGSIDPVYDEFRACDKIHSTSWILGSAIIPGWGQFYKKKPLKGVVFLATEAGLIIATCNYENKRKYNNRKSDETTNIDLIKEYRKRADTKQLQRNIAFGCAIAVHAINLLDAALIKGESKYAFIPDNLKLYAYNDGDINHFGLRIKF